MTEQRFPHGESRHNWAFASLPALVTLLLALLIFAFYFPAYRIRHYALPVGLVVAALAAIARRLDGRRGMIAAVVFLVASGLVHWVFLAVFGVVLFVAVVLALPASVREWRLGLRPARTEAVILTTVGTATAAVMAVLVAGVLHAPFQTFEIREDPRRFLPKFKNDLKKLRLAVTGPVAAIGVAVLARGPFGQQRGSHVTGAVGGARGLGWLA